MGLRRIAIASAVGAMFLVGACGQATVESGPSTELHMSRVKDYTIADLRAESTMVVRGTASTSREEEADKVPVTFTRLRLDQHVAGLRAGAEWVEIVQLGGSAVSSPDTSPLLADGDRYLLFLKPYTAKSRSSVPAFVITGDQGVFRESSGGYEFTGAPSDELPARFTADSLVAQARP
jgi:hypothetical protein